MSDMVERRKSEDRYLHRFARVSWPKQTHDAETGGDPEKAKIHKYLEEQSLWAAGLLRDLATADSAYDKLNPSVSPALAVASQCSYNSTGDAPAVARVQPQHQLCSGERISQLRWQMRQIYPPALPAQVLNTCNALAFINVSKGKAESATVCGQRRTSLQISPVQISPQAVPPTPRTWPTVSYAGGLAVSVASGYGFVIKKLSQDQFGHSTWSQPVFFTVSQAGLGVTAGAYS